VVGHDVGCLPEPEGGKLVKHLSFVGDATGQNDIECRYSVGGDDK
jgi:hypothetical protein